jgi:hypothetical protein
VLEVEAWLVLAKVADDVSIGADVVELALAVELLQLTALGIEIPSAVQICCRKAMLANYSDVSHVVPEPSGNTNCSGPPRHTCPLCSK